MGGDPTISSTVCGAQSPWLPGTTTSTQHKQNLFVLLDLHKSGGITHGGPHLQKDLGRQDRQLQPASQSCFLSLTSHCLPLSPGGYQSHSQGECWLRLKYLWNQQRQWRSKRPSTKSKWDSWTEHWMGNFPFLFENENFWVLHLSNR